MKTGCMCNRVFNLAVPDMKLVLFVIPFSEMEALTGLAWP